MVDGGTRSGATLVDRGFQLAYFGAYRLMRVYWTLRRPMTHGSLVALRNAGEVLLIRNSYVRYYGLPGGYVRRGETARRAALRELSEEVGLSADPDRLELVFDETNDWAGKRDHVQIFTLDLQVRPAVEVDHREVIEASWWSPERALSLDLFPPVRKVVEKMVRRPAAS